jgi:hypothetical protein
MIYEYALEPELVATWTDRRDFRYFVERFGLGQGRIVSRYPKRWTRLVWDAFDGAGELDRKRLEELLARLSECMVRRADIHWDPASASWLDNAEREHERRPFHAIVARANPRGHPRVLVGADLDERSEPLWAASRGRSVQREAGAMADAVAPALRSSSVVIFVDPYFGPERSRHRRPFEAFLERMLKDRPGRAPERVEVHTAAEETGTEDFFRGECHARLRRCVPEGMRIVIRRLGQKAGGEKLHNRYVLTELGGIAFGVGLDDGDDGETDDLTLLDREVYELRWSQYNGDPPPGFDQDEASVEVIGTRKLR